MAMYGMTRTALLLDSYCFRDSKGAEKIWQSARKDVAKMPFSIYRYLGIGYLEKHLIVV